MVNSVTHSFLILSCQNLLLSTYQNAETIRWSAEIQSQNVDNQLPVNESTHANPNFLHLWYFCTILFLMVACCFVWLDNRSNTETFVKLKDIFILIAYLIFTWHMLAKM